PDGAAWRCRCRRPARADRRHPHQAARKIRPHRRRALRGPRQGGRVHRHGAALDLRLRHGLCLRGPQLGMAFHHLRSFTAAGLLLGTLFFAASLTPSLVPRPTAVQGVLSGLSFAAGYGIGFVLQVLWRRLQLPVPAGRPRFWLAAGTGLLCAGLAGLALWKASGWQNTLRALMDMP